MEIRLYMPPKAQIRSVALIYIIGRGTVARVEFALA